MVGRCISPRSVRVDVQAREMGRRQHRGTGEVQRPRSVSTGTRNLARSRITAFYISKPIACVPGRPIIWVNLRHCRHDGWERSPDLHCVCVLSSVATRTTGPTEQVYTMDTTWTLLPQVSHAGYRQLRRHHHSPARSLCSRPAVAATLLLWLFVCCFSWVRRRRSVV